MRFPPRQIDIGDVSAGASAGKVQLGEVSFTHSASASWGIRVSPDPSKLLAAVSPNENLTTALSFPPDAQHRYLMRWTPSPLYMNAPRGRRRLGLSRQNKTAFP